MALDGRSSPDRFPEAPDESLTRREGEVLARLGISDQTVKFHVATIMAKRGAANRTEALRRGLIALSS